MNGDEKIGMHRVGARGPLEQTSPGWGGGDEEGGLVEAGLAESLLDLSRKLKIERIFRNAARADGAGYVDGMADIDDDAEFRPLASVGFRRGRRRLFASRRDLVAGDDEDQCEQCADCQLGAPKADRDSRLHPQFLPYRLDDAIGRNLARPRAGIRPISRA